MSRHLPVAGLLLGLLLVAVGWRREANWAGRGTLVAELRQDVPGAPPWRRTIPVGVAGERYLVESTVLLEPAERGVTVTASPELRLSDPAGQRLDEALEPLPHGRTVSGPGGVAVTNHWWFRPRRAGEHRFELATLNTEPAGLTPRRWSLRLATDVPDQPPGGAGLRLAGFALAVLGGLGLLVRPAGRSDATAPVR